MSGALLLCVLLSVCGFYGSCQSIRGSVVRLHILANSDSNADQQLKLQVRDAVQIAAAGWLDGATNVEEARFMAQEALPQLEAIAQKTVRDAGYDYPVKATLCRTYFTTRQYGTVTLPAGMYEAVQFTIGSGQGHNWWCVVFPPMCLGAAADPTALHDVLNDGQFAFVSGAERVTVRFKIIEWAEGLIRRFRR